MIPPSNFLDQLAYSCNSQKLAEYLMFTYLKKEYVLTTIFDSRSRYTLRYFTNFFASHLQNFHPSFSWV